MNKIKTIRSLLATGGVLVALSLGSAAQAAALVNGNFAGLAGWQTVGDASASGNTLWLSNAATGSDAHNISGTSAVETWALPATLQPYVPLLDTADGEALEVSGAGQGFSAAAGSVLSFKWNFGTYDSYQGDYGFVAVDGQIFSLASLASFAPTDADLIGSAGLLTGWRDFSITLSGNGSHSVIFGVVDIVDTALTSTLAIADVRVSAVPEPSSWALALVGLAAIGGVARRRQRTAG